MRFRSAVALGAIVGVALFSLMVFFGQADADVVGARAVVFVCGVVVGAIGGSAFWYVLTRQRLPKFLIGLASSVIAVVLSVPLAGFWSFLTQKPQSTPAGHVQGIGPTIVFVFIIVPTVALVGFVVGFAQGVRRDRVRTTRADNFPRN